MDVGIRVAEPGDLGALTASMGQRHFFADRLARQARGGGVLLLAALAGVVVGDVYVSWEPPGEPELARHLPGVPSLVHLEVAPDVRRRRIGTCLVERAEAEAMRRGAGRVLLGVEGANRGARRLYERLGYVEWGHGTVPTGWMIERDGRHVLYRTEVHVLVKELSIPPG
ncbi:MAG TPA: GNAT family N-acetyltransferase [Acidimicrobiales bacterium]|nr:GNAT family N-acetyltransferase [Acidimicrobiales bacterium]